MASFTTGTLDGKQIAPVVISSAAGGDIVIAAGVAGQIIRLYKIWFVVTGASNMTFKDGSTALSGTAALAANGSFVLDMDGTPWATTSAGNALNLNSSAATQVSGIAYITQGY